MIFLRQHTSIQCNKFSHVSVDHLTSIVVPLYIPTYTAEDVMSFIEEELVIFTKKLNLIQSSKDNGHEKVKEVSSLLSEINLENITSEITKATSDAFNSLDKSTTNCELVE